MVLRYLCTLNVLLVACATVFIPTVNAAFTSDAQSNEDLQNSVVELKVIRGVAIQQQNIDYFHRILAEALALNELGNTYILKKVNFEYPQNRTLRLLNDPNALDITYSMTSSFRERAYVPIKIPLLNGLYGKRKLVVAAEDKAVFETLTENQLKEKIACQGANWPDYTKLKENGYAVYGVSEYEANFKMLANKRCDYIPRGLAEVEWEMDIFNNKYGAIATVDNIMLSYDAPVYFFTGKHNKALARVVEKGLQQLYDSGRLNDVLDTTDAFYYDRNFESNPLLRVFRLN